MQKGLTLRGLIVVVIIIVSLIVIMISRFERLREGSIVEWFKRINEYLKEIDGNIYVGINFVYKERFRKYLSTENKNKIMEFGKTEYSGLSGIYQYKSRLEKNNC